jgi:hypothetical protein
MSGSTSLTAKKRRRSVSSRLALAQLGDIDLNIGPERHGDVRDKVFHLNGTSEYLFIDVCVQSHSRQFEFVRGHDTERPLVLFDKAGVIRYSDLDSEGLRRDIARRLRYREVGFAQRARVVRAAKRGHFLEALAYYHKFVLQPLVELLRLQYAPQKADYWLKHIERDLPPPVRDEIRPLFAVTSALEIEAAVAKAATLFERASTEVRAQYRLE